MRIDFRDPNIPFSPPPYPPRQLLKTFLLQTSPFFMGKGVKTSGVVGRERMGTAFPHKKLSGNGVPTREISRDIF